MVDRANLRPGQKVFIQAGSGGVGTIAIQLARHLGAKVATTTSAANAELVGRLGAQVAIDYRKDDFEKVIADYDVVLNSQDTATLEKSLRVLRKGGIAVSISGPPDPASAHEKAFNVVVGLLMRLLSRSIRAKAKAAGIRYGFLFMQSSGTQTAELAKLIEAGAIRPVINRVFPFERLNEAMEYIETGRAKGKVVVSVA